MMEALGLADIVETVISDNSKAAAAYIAGAQRLIHHVLCFWHFRKNFSQSLTPLFQTAEDCVTKKSRVLTGQLNKFSAARYNLVLVMFFGDPMLQYSSSIYILVQSWS